jgi:hypothetical protein
MFWKNNLRRRYPHLADVPIVCFLDLQRRRKDYGRMAQRYHNLTFGLLVVDGTAFRF